MELTESPALALTFSDLLSRRAQRRFARDKLARYSKADLTVPTTWGLFAAIADRLRELGRPKEAVEIFQGLEQQEIPEKVLLAFLRRGIQAAEDAGKSELAASWRIRVDPPPPPPETTETDPETGLPEVAGDPSEEENAP